MISSSPGTIGEGAVSVASGQVCAPQTKNMTRKEGGSGMLYFLAFSPTYTAAHLPLTSPVFASGNINHMHRFDVALNLDKKFTWCRSAAGMS